MGVSPSRKMLWTLQEFYEYWVYSVQFRGELTSDLGHPLGLGKVGGYFDAALGSKTLCRSSQILKLLKAEENGSAMWLSQPIMYEFR